MLEAIPPTKPRSLAEHLAGHNFEAVDLIAECLSFSPDKRTDVAGALTHPFVAEFHDPEDEPSRHGGAVRLETDDNSMLRPADYRSKLFKEIERRRQVARADVLSKLKRPTQTALQVLEDV